MTVQGFVLLETPPEVLCHRGRDVDVYDVAHWAHPAGLSPCVVNPDCSSSVTTRGSFIGRGSPIKNLQTKLDTIRLTKCMRTDRQGLVAAAQSIRNGRPLEECDEVRIEPAQDPVHRIASYMFASEEKEDATGTDDASAIHNHAIGGVAAPWDDGYIQVITPQNNHVDQINEMVQERLTKEDSFPGSRGVCYIGDAVRFTENSEHGYKNGDEGMAIRPFKIEVMAAAGRRREEEGASDLR